VNPFDLPGPDFLLFFWVFALAVLVLAALVRRRVEAGEVPRLEVVDPYLIACLRGGPEEAIKLAVLSLSERGLLTEDGGHVVKAVDGAQDKVTPEIERRVLEAVAMATATDARALLRDEQIRSATRALGHALEKQGLTPSSKQRDARMMISLCALVLVTAVAMTKVVLALQRGHHNVGILVLSCVAMALLLIKVLDKRQTLVGQRLLADLSSLFDGLRVRLHRERASGAPHENMLVAAVFGLAVGPLRADRLFASDPGGGSSGSSCGSSGGGGCGGGGCGGGGCGGCGS
jgi:uncharacterized protein (TIGR04222 family)